VPESWTAFASFSAGGVWPRSCSARPRRDVRHTARRLYDPGDRPLPAPCGSWDARHADRLHRVGSVLGSVALLALARRPNKGEPLPAGFFVTALAIAALGISSSVPLSLALAVVGGFCGVLFVGLSTVVVQAASPDALRARVMAIWAAAFVGMLGRPQVAWLGCAALPEACVAAADPAAVAFEAETGHAPRGETSPAGPFWTWRLDNGPRGRGSLTSGRVRSRFGSSSRRSVRRGSSRDGSADPARSCASHRPPIPVLRGVLKGE
jgi:hypothetical protein